MSEQIEQGSPEWFAARLGKLTASRIADATAKTRSGWGAGRKNYMSELIIERLTGQPAQSFSNAAMQWGTETEPQARAAYEWRTGCDVELVGFVDHPVYPMAGASPDGLIGDKGLIEIKCPNPATHVDTLLSEKIPVKYIKQIQFQMICTNREWCDYVSFDPRMPEGMELFIRRVERDDEMGTDLDYMAREFLAELDEKESQLREKFELSEAA